MAQTRRKKRRHAKSRHPFIKFLIIAGALVMVGCILCQSVYFVDRKIYPHEEYGEIIEKAANTYNLEEPLIYAVINTESHFEPDAESGVGAKGLMQMMPSTFEWLQNLRGESYDEDSLFYPEINIDYGCYFLRYLIDMFGEESTAVAAYNAGFAIVEEWLANPEYSSDGKTLDTIPYPETDEYVKKVEKMKQEYIKRYYS